MGKISVKITGAEETSAAMMKYYDELATKIKPVVMKHSKQVVKQYRAVTPKGKTGNLQKSVAQRMVTRTKKTSFISGTARSVIARASSRGKGYHRHLASYGSRERFTRSGASRGKMPANPGFAEVNKKVDRTGFDKEIEILTGEDVKI